LISSLQVNVFVTFLEENASTTQGEKQELVLLPGHLQPVQTKTGRKWVRREEGEFGFKRKRGHYVSR
jgi:hypothetical protein